MKKVMIYAADISRSTTKKRSTFFQLGFRNSFQSNAIAISSWENSRVNY